MPKTTSTFACDCCLCLYVRQLRDCCTNDLVPIAVCSGVDRYTTVLYGGKCYKNTEEIVSRATAIANGWSILNNNFQVFDGQCEDDNCYYFYQIFVALCGADEVDTDSPIQSLVGPLTERPAEPYTNVYAQINGRWFRQEGILQLKKECETIEDQLGEGVEYEVIATTVATTQSEKPLMCCHKCYESGEWPNTSSRFWTKPCCLQITGFAFSGCGTDTSGLPDWDGKLFSNWLEADDAYAQAMSSTTEPCYGNWDSCNGKIPGTNTALVAGTILWWSCDDNVWYLQLGFTWVGSGGSDPEDPTGTYTAIGTPSCGGPATLTVTAI